MYNKSVGGKELIEAMDPNSRTEFLVPHFKVSEWENVEVPYAFTYEINKQFYIIRTCPKLYNQ
jgi:hypothetical protein